VASWKSNVDLDFGHQRRRVSAQFEPGAAAMNVEPGGTDARTL
jgi:hypothetical protein